MTDDRRGPVTILHGDTRAIPLPDASVDLIVTSPPYWSQRSYRDGGEHYAGQIGAEQTPAEYIAALIDSTREWVRVLKPSGSLFVNLGDKQVSKRLLFLPERYRIACADQLGLIGRAVIVWAKPNGLPESVTDRVRRSHEDWVHLVRQPRYFSAVDEIREPHKYPGDERWKRQAGGDYATSASGHINSPLNPLGKLPGSVWEIPTEPLKVPDHLGVDHFAAFPTEWPRRIIQGWSPSGICTACGEGRRPVVDRSEKRLHRPSDAEFLGRGFGGPNGEKRGNGNVRTVAKMTGEACACPDTSAPTRPATVLDPFGGTGTTALVASVLGRHGISVDMSADYCRIAEWRTSDARQRSRIVERAKKRARIPTQRKAADVA